MPLDQDIANTLRLMDAAGLLKPYAGRSATDIRAGMAPLEQMRKNLGVQVASETDLRMPGPGGDLTLRVYRPQGEGPFPVLVYFHGGGFVLGNLDSHSHICRELVVRSGAMVVSVDYRLAPEHPFPAAVDDAYAAVCWIAAHAAEFGGDGSRLAVGGDSAGGNLATLCCLRCRDEGGPVIRFQLLAYPGTDLESTLPSRRDNAQGYFLTADAIAWFFSQYLAGADPKHPWVSPLHAPDLSRLPPALMITAEYDPLRDEGEAYAARLAQAGVKVKATRYGNTIHGFLGPSTAKGSAALDEAAAMLKQALEPRA